MKSHEKRNQGGWGVKAVWNRLRNIRTSIYSMHENEVDKGIVTNKMGGLDGKRSFSQKMVARTRESSKESGDE